MTRGRTGQREAARKRASHRLGLLLTSSLLALGLVALSLLGALPFLPLPPWLQAGLLVLVGAGIVAGSRAVRPLPVSVPATAPASPGAGDRADDDVEDTRGLLAGFSRTLATIEQQAAEVDRFARRLDAAYSELEFANARLKEFSFKDDVTGLYNRRFFTIRLEEEVSRYRRFNHPVSVVLLDLDGFKAINDDLGHAAGDETLRDMAEILMRYSRGINVICRYGGDEFIVLLVETSKDGARLYADRIRHVLSRHPFAHGRPLTASFGIASLPEDVTPAADDLIRAADEALYAAKRAGKNRVSVFEDTAPASLPGRAGGR
jgi:diguanylate cyclase (GGDEF)-like protein